MIGEVVALVDNNLGSMAKWAIQSIVSNRTGLKLVVACCFGYLLVVCQGMVFDLA